MSSVRIGLVRSGFVAELESVRGLAALFVFFSHIANYMLPGSNYPNAIHPVISLPSILRLCNGFAAGLVILFFVLSGYVLNLMWTGGRLIDSLPSFLIRRAVRLIPPMMLSIIVTYVASRLAVVLDGPFRMRAPQPSDLAANLILQRTDINAVIWSLKVELYCCLGLPFYLLARDRSRLLSAVCALAFAFLPPIFTAPNDQNLFIFNFVFFIIGAEVGYLPRVNQGRSAVNIFVFFVCLVGLFALSILEYANGLDSTGVWLFVLAQHGLHLIQGISSFLIVAILAGTMGIKPFADVWNWSPVRYLGVMSYSLYLIHPAVLISITAIVSWALHANFPVASLHFRLFWASLIIPLALAAAHMLYQWIEKPCIAISRRLGAVLQRRSADH